VTFSSRHHRLDDTRDLRGQNIAVLKKKKNKFLVPTTFFRLRFREIRWPPRLFLCQKQKTFFFLFRFTDRRIYYGYGVSQRAVSIETLHTVANINTRGGYFLYTYTCRRRRCASRVASYARRREYTNDRSETRVLAQRKSRSSRIMFYCSIARRKEINIPLIIDIRTRARLCTNTR